MSFSNRIRRLDVFKKFPKEVSQATNLGGLLSIVTTLLILYFLVVEFRNYLNPTYSAQLTLDDLLTREEMRYASRHSA